MSAHAITWGRKWPSRHGFTYAQAQCACGWTGDWTPIRHIAGWDVVKRHATEHLAAV